MEGLGATVTGLIFGSSTRALMSMGCFAGGEVRIRECARSAGDQGGNCSHEFLVLRSVARRDR
jgi:hypothetical protein